MASRNPLAKLILYVHKSSSNYIYFININTDTTKLLSTCSIFHLFEGQISNAISAPNDGKKNHFMKIDIFKID